MNYLGHKKIIICAILILAVSCHCHFMAQSKYDSINWEDQFKVDCKPIWEEIGIADSLAENAFTYMQFTRCALKRNDVDKAKKFLQYSKLKGNEDTLILSIIEARILVKENRDAEALDFLNKIATHVNMQQVLKMEDFQKLINRNVEASKFAEKFQPSLNVFTFLIAAFSLFGLIASIALVYNKRVNRHAMKWLSGLLAVTCIIMISFVMYWSGFFNEYPYLNGLWHFLYFLMGPFYFFYISTIFEKEPSAKMKIFHLAFPIVIFILLLLSGNLFIDINVKINENLKSLFLSFILKLIHLSFYFILAFRVSLGDWMVDSKIRFWRNVILSSFAIFIVANGFYYVLTFWSGFNESWDYFISAVMALGVLGVVIIALIEPKYLHFGNYEMPKTKKVLIAERETNDLNAMNVTKDGIKNEKYQTSSLTDSASMSIKLKLETLMTTKEIFKENELRIQDVSDLLGVSKHHLSQVINENYGINFFEFVNRYRINYAIQLLSKPKNPYTISEIAYQSGFNNKVTFYKVFKQYYKITPLEYINIKDKERILLS